MELFQNKTYLQSNNPFLSFPNLIKGGSLQKKTKKLEQEAFRGDPHLGAKRKVR